MAVAAGGRIGRVSLGRGIGQRGRVFTRIRLTTIFIAKIFIPATLPAGVFPAKLVVEIVAVIVIVIVGGKVAAGKNVVGKLVGGRLVVARLERGGRGDFRRRVAEILQKGLLEVLLAQGGGIVGYGFFLVESDLAGVGADETSIEDSAGKLVKVFVFKSAQHADTDFRAVGDVIELEAAQLALLAKFFPKGAHVRLLLSFRPHPDVTIIGEGGGRRQTLPSNRCYRRVGRYLGS